MLAAYFGEFTFTIFYYIYISLILKQSLAREIRFNQFLIPALCDFVENLLLIFSVGKMLPSMSMMIGALALPISALFSRWSVLRIRKIWTMKQVLALAGILVGVLWIFFVSLEL